MTTPQQYTPGPANLARVQKDGEKWTLVLVRQLRHSPEKVWRALTDPAQLRGWAPFDADGNMGVAGSTVKLNTVGTAAPLISETMDHSLSGIPLSRIVGPEAMKFEGWQRLNADYAKQFGSGPMVVGQ